MSSMRPHLISVLFLSILFHKNYTFVPQSNCGSTFFENIGHFSTPTFYNAKASHTPTCEWRILAQQDETIILNINEMDMEKTPNCSSTFVEVRDGYWEDSPFLGRYCGEGTLIPIRSTANKMYVFYKHQPGSRGFAATYESVCGETLYVRHEMLLQPYQDTYSHNKRCLWNIVVPQHHQVVLNFKKFNLEEHSECLYDYLEIIDGKSHLGKYCGNRTPLNIVSTSNSIQLKFVSDSSVQKEGFVIFILAEYNECVTPYHGCAQECINTPGSYICVCRNGFELQNDRKTCTYACGGVVNSTIQGGVITSPHFPNLANKTCMWDIVAPPGNLIGLNFSHFNIEGEYLTGNKMNKCTKDKLKVYSMVDGNRKVNHGIFCGSATPDFIASESNEMVIVAIADHDEETTSFSFNYFAFPNHCIKHDGNCHHKCINTSPNTYKCICPRGFTLADNKLDCIKNPCTHQLSTPSGTIHSPNWPRNYSIGVNCTYTFKVTPGFKLKLNVVSLDTEECCDCLEIFDKAYSSTNSIEKLCGAKKNVQVLSDTNELFMTFFSDSRNTGSGFEITYSTQCGGIWRASDETRYIYSHLDYLSSNYPSNFDCEWIILPAYVGDISLVVESVEIEESEDCEYDFMEIFRGDQFLGRYCGTNKPSEEFVGRLPFVIHFHSDDSFQMKGFHIMYTITEEIK